MTQADFDLRALWEALDQQRRARSMTWAAVAREVNRFVTVGHPMSASTISGLKEKPWAEGDGILQMLLWLGHTPESFVPDLAGGDAERFRLPEVAEDRILRWDTAALHGAMNAERNARGLTWQGVAQEIGGYTPGMLTRLAKGGRIGCPGVMRIVRWHGEPAARFTRAARRRLPFQSTDVGA